MVQAAINNNYNILKRAFYVSNRNLNDDGMLDICKILKEIVNLNDKAILRTYGNLDYDFINTWHYNVSFSGEADLDDLIELESRYTVSEDNALNIRLYVSKKQGVAREPIAEGSFVFTNNH